MNELNDTYDFICVGGGLGGLAAAIRARDLGLSVLVLEKTNYVGGVAAYSGGSIWAPRNHLSREAGETDSREAIEAYFAFVGGAGLPHDERLRATFLDAVPEAIEYFATDGGVPFSTSRIQDQYYPQAPGSTTNIRHVEVVSYESELGDWAQKLRPTIYMDPDFSIDESVRARIQGVPVEQLVDPDELASRRARGFMARGRGMAGGFLNQALRKGATIVTDAAVTSLLVEDGAVVGVGATIDGQPREIRSTKGVLIATGSYSHHPGAPAMEGLPELFEQSPPILDGDGLRLAQSIGGKVVRAGYPFCTLGYESATMTHPGTDVPIHYPVIEALAKPHIIAVNSRAQRFGDESFYGVFASSITAYDGNEKAFANWPTYAILDDRFRTNDYEFGWMAGWPEGEMVSGNTLEELAENLGLDPVALVATVKQYNEAVAAGHDPEFGRGSLAVSASSGDARYPNPNLGSIEQAPFWGKRLHILTAGILTHGLSINENAAVLDVLDRPIPGLYATGNAVAHAELPFGYENGFANGRNIVYAYLAATHATG